MGNAMNVASEYGKSMLQGCVAGGGMALAYGGVKSLAFGPEGVGALAVVGCAAGAVGASIGLHQSRIEAAHAKPAQAMDAEHGQVAPKAPKPH